MASTAQTPQSSQPPPDVPADPSVSETLTQYLRTFSLWCRKGFQDRLPANTAISGLLVSSWDTLPGHTPKVFMLRVSEAGAVSAAPVEVGGDMRARSVGSGP